MILYTVFSSIPHYIFSLNVLSDDILCLSDQHPDGGVPLLLVVLHIELLPYVCLTRTLTQELISICILTP